MPDPIAPLASLSIGFPSPDALAPFSCALLGLTEAFATSDRGIVSLPAPAC